jgi:glycerol-1-phosphate dehydrogenase [NAD(P)+]
MSRSTTFDLDAVRQRLDSSDDAAGLHPIGLSAVYSGTDTLSQLGSVVRDLIPRGPAGGVMLLTDSRPKLRTGEDVADLACTLLSDFAVDRVTLGGGQANVHANPATVAEAVDGATRARCLVSIGSGTIVDIGKVVAARRNLPHIVVQTATSVNGFADDQSVLLIDGVKRTTPSRWPDVLIIDAELISCAPRALNLAGIGDLVSMFTAPADWQLAFQLGMSDDYSATAVRLTREHGDDVLQSATALARADVSAVERVAHVLTLSGISMGVAGTTAPSSGMEHTVSHLIDMAMNQLGVESAYHGAQVGVSAVVAATVWRRVLTRVDAGPIALQIPDAAEMSTRVHAAFTAIDPSGRMAAECWRLYSRKLARLVAILDRMESVDWARVARSAREVLADPDVIAHSLSAAGAPATFSALDPPVDPSTVRWALRNCHLMRDRFTVADLAVLLGMWEETDLDEILDVSTAIGERR